MLVSISDQLDNIRNENFKEKIKSELEYFKEVGILTPFENGHEVSIEERTKLLELVLDQPEIYQNTIQQKKDVIFQEIDKYTYRKQWNKLPAFHKIVKIKEYLEENVSDKKMRKELLTKLTEHANKKRINTKKYVIYDPNKAQILSMPCIEIDEEDKTFKLNII